MSIIIDHTLLANVYVEHPFEPILCKKQKADIILFINKDELLPIEQIYFLILQYNYNLINNDVLQKKFGIYLLELFDDRSLRKCIFEYSKPFFEKYSASTDYKYYYRKYIGE